MSKEIEITLKIKVKKMNWEDAEDLGLCREEHKHFDIDLVDADTVKEVLEEYFDAFSISDDVPCPNEWPWYISKITPSLNVPNDAELIEAQKIKYDSGEY